MGGDDVLGRRCSAPRSLLSKPFPLRSSEESSVHEISFDPSEIGQVQGILFEQCDVKEEEDQVPSWLSQDIHCSNLTPPHTLEIQ